ncbi:hypothetical protein [Brevundimonas sp. A19_0]|uniref:hypothetical protein n=1 Tax=Brevundimonas sp. A19_0 TaxID=2821087 RepID=UPI001ADBA76E|nr:hypothetical protein [Brevundimonas sp. A19_0]MBO9501318.1 hypothetical protein [Brevundimonas sp. A19_0]
MPPFERSVFINCPFDEDFAPILQAMAFCVVFLGFWPRLAPENADNASGRLDRIVELIGSSKYAIHDLSRCRAKSEGDLARMNMPFELGLDYGCRKFGDDSQSSKSILIFEHERYEYQKVLSDISGWDIRAHGSDFEKAMAHVRDWLVGHAGAERLGRALVSGKYVAFQEWYWEMQLAAGSSEEDIREYPTGEMITAMHEWMAAGQPT